MKFLTTRNFSRKKPEKAKKPNEILPARRNSKKPDPRFFGLQKSQMAALFGISPK